MNIKSISFKNIFTFLLILSEIALHSVVLACPPETSKKGHFVNQTIPMNQEAELVQTIKNACIAMASEKVDAQKVVRQFGTPIFDENAMGGGEWRKGIYNLKPSKPFFKEIGVFEKRYHQLSPDNLSPAQIDEVFPVAVASMHFYLTQDVTLTIESLKKVFGEYKQGVRLHYDDPESISFFSKLPEISPYMCLLHFDYYTKTEKIEDAKFVEIYIEIRNWSL
jgi:hypothetical protein